MVGRLRFARLGAAAASLVLLAACQGIDINRLIGEMAADTCRAASNCDVYDGDQRYGPPPVDRPI